MIARCVGTALAATGVFLLIVAAFSIWESMLYQWSGHAEFDAPEGAARRVHAAAQASGTAQRSRPSRGMTLARLEVPRLNMSVVVLEGSDDEVLKKGPGHIEDTAFPGELGNVAIAGHRDTHFRPLRNIRPNDEVILTTRGVTIRYFIDTMHITHPTDMQILDPTPGPALTLVTCYPFEFIGNAPMRYVIRATPRDSAAGGNGTYAKR